MASPRVVKGAIAVVTTGGSTVGIVSATVSSAPSTTSFAQVYSGKGDAELASSTQPEIDLAEAIPEAATQDLLEIERTKADLALLNEQQKQKVRDEAKKALDRIDDYSFKLFAPCGIGTGWILDYRLPKDSKEYPTTWYIATNAHVIKNYRFVENDYNQQLPIPMHETNRLRWVHQDAIKILNAPLGSWASCNALDQYGYFDLGLSKASNWKELQPESGFIKTGKMEEIKLFYMPFNFLDLKAGSYSEEVENNYRDFAVLELKFKYPEFARKLTNDFAKKYNVESKDAINIFADPLDKKHSWDKLDGVKDNFYSLAYPWQEHDKYSYTTNFDENTLETSNLAKDLFHLTDKKINGYVDAKKMEDRFPKLKTPWGGKTLSEVGHLYLVDKFAMIGGSSGGLYTDKDGNILGIKRLAEPKGTKHNFLVPLRSSEIKKEGIVMSPEYDLIRGGGKGQKTSYKDQVERYVIRNKSDRKTWLSARGWQHKS